MNYIGSQSSLKHFIIHHPVGILLCLFCICVTKLKTGNIQGGRGHWNGNYTGPQSSLKNFIMHHTVGILLCLFCICITKLKTGNIQ